MARTASEIFGHPIDLQTARAQADRTKHRCPFTGVKCTKRSRLVKYPTGACSVLYQNDDIALCPKRFLENDTVFRDIAQAAFGSLDNLLRFDQVKLGKIGSLDYVIVKHKPLSSEIEDFVVVEFQTGQTTSTGKLIQALKDFKAGQDIQGKTYKFGMNFFDIWKREFTQILFKGMVMEQWGTRIYWIVQTPIFKFLKDKYHLASLKPGRDNHTVFALYDLKRVGDSLKLTLHHSLPLPLGEGRVRGNSDCYWSVTMDGLFHDLRHSQPVPSKAEFVSRLKARVTKELRVRLKIEAAR